MKKICILVLSTLLVCSCQTGKVKPALDLEKGKTYKQHFKTTSAVIQEVGGGKVGIENGVFGSLSYLVNDIEGACYDLEVSYDSLGIEVEMGGEKYVLSSERDDGNVMFGYFFGMMKSTAFELKLCQDGKLEEKPVADSLYQVYTRNKDTINKARYFALRDQVMGQYGRKAFKGNIELVTAIFPETSVQAGDSWTITQTMEFGLQPRIRTDVTMTYTLEEVGDDYFVIHGEAKIVTDENSVLINKDEKELMCEMEGLMVSDIEVDKQTGWVVKAKIEQRLSGYVIGDMTKGLPNEMKAPLEMRNLIVISGG